MGVDKWAQTKDQARYQSQRKQLDDTKSGVRQEVELESCFCHSVETACTYTWQTKDGRTSMIWFEAVH
jgi:hypothetical protein